MSLEARAARQEVDLECDCTHSRKHTPAVHRRTVGGVAAAAAAADGAEPAERRPSYCVNIGVITVVTTTSPPSLPLPLLPRFPAHTHTDFIMQEN